MQRVLEDLGDPVGVGDDLECVLYLRICGLILDLAIVLHENGRVLRDHVAN